MSEYYLGVDFGKEGGLALLNPCGEIEKISAMPITTKKVKQKSGKVKTESELNFRELKHFIMKCDSEIGTDTLKVYGEKLKPIYNVSNKATFGLGEIYGSTKAVFSSYGLDVSLVEAVKWQEHIWQEYKIKRINKKGKKARDTKAMALDAVQLIYPGLDFRKNSRCKKPHDGIVDAVLIARYAMEVS